MRGVGFVEGVVGFWWVGGGGMGLGGGWGIGGRGGMGWGGGGGGSRKRQTLNLIGNLITATEEQGESDPDERNVIMGGRNGGEL